MLRLYVAAGETFAVALAKDLAPILSRAGSADLAEHAREVLLRFEAACHRNVEHTCFGFA